MSKSIEQLAPQAVWKHFYSLTQIPRPSKKEAAVVAFMEAFAREHNLEFILDKVGNVIIRKPATPGMENRKGIILQGHLDMVPQKNNDTNHDFEKDPIEAYVDGEWVTANGTTLGADNGIGVAAAMAILEAKDIEHGPVEALMTIDEETGMTGAFGLEPGVLEGDILINLDSEDEGELYIGCAGGTDANAEFAYTEVPVNGEVTGIKISVTGMKGGHSGMDIVLGRGNANKTLFRFLRNAAREFGFRLSEVEGGSLRNAIPREAWALGTVPSENLGAIDQALNAYAKIAKAELAATEPDMDVACEVVNAPMAWIDLNTQNNLINAINACPNGVIRMSDAMENLVETSTNLAIVKSGKGKVQVSSLMRSSVDSAKDALGEMIASVFELAGAKIEFAGTYPGWRPNPDSEVLELAKKVYNEKYGKVPEIKAIHAGLECGLLGAVYPHWDMISFGPTIRYPHSPDEKVNIATVGKFYDYLVEMLKNAPIRS
jgi:dipeptidase D